MGFFVGANSAGFVLLRCSSGATRAYSVAWEDGLAVHKNAAIVACDFGYSSNESCIRTVGGPDHVNVCWTTLTQDTSKSCLRFASGEYLAAYGGYWIDGDNSVGAQSATSPVTQFVRIESNYASGDISATALIAGFTTDAHYTTASNNICYDESGFNYGAGDVGKLNEYNKLLHNTMLQKAASTTYFVVGARSNETYQENNRFAANVLAHEAPANMSTYFVDIGNDVATFENNIFPATQTGLIKFCRVWVGGSVNRNLTTLADFNNETWATGNTEEDVTLNGRYEPNSPTTVTTETGVYDDYYGSSRGSASYVGAVIASPTSTKRVMVLQ